MDAYISAILPTYNRAHLIERAIVSALRQIKDKDELIIIDDGSEDETKELVNKYLQRVKYIRIQHSGCGAARNAGVKAAINPFVVFLDSDDEWMPNRIELQRRFMANCPDLLFSFGNFACKDEAADGGNEIRFALVPCWSKDYRSWNDILGPGEAYSFFAPLPEGVVDFLCYIGNLYESLMTSFYINVNTLMVRREEAGDNLHFTENAKITEDWECTARLARAGRCAYMDCEMAWQHAHKGPRVTDATSLEFATAQIEMMQRVWGCDQTFLNNHGDLYRSILDKQRLVKAEGLILRGQTKEARQELRRLSKRPLPHVLLAALPGAAAKGVLAVRRSLKKI